MSTLASDYLNNGLREQSPSATPDSNEFWPCVKACFSKYATFAGRARRSEYWYFVLFSILCGFVAGFVDALVGISVFATLAQLVFLLPGLAVVVRRLHDTGRSGWNYLWCLLPIIGWIMLLVWECSDSQPGTNQYGANPKGL